MSNSLNSWRRGLPTVLFVLPHLCNRPRQRHSQPILGAREVKMPAQSLRHHRHARPRDTGLLRRLSQVLTPAGS